MIKDADNIKSSGKRQRRPRMLDVLESIAPLKIKCVGWGVIGLFWVLGVWAFIAQRVGIFDALFTPMQLLTDMVLILLGVWTIRNAWDIAVLVIYLVVSAISTIWVNELSPTFWLNGSRFYFYIIFLTPIFRWILSKKNRAIYFIEKFDASLYVFLWLQVPSMIFEYVALGGNDQGGGTLGNYMSHIISCLIYCISFYLMLKKWDKEKGYISNLLANWTLIFLLCPTFMNETKVSFIYLVLYFFFLVPFNRKFVRNILITIPFIAVGLIAAVYLYLNTVDVSDEQMSLEWLEYYVMGDDETYEIMESMLDTYGNDEDRDFMRGAKFLMLPAVLVDKPWGVWVGYGASQYKGASVMEKTEFLRRYEWFFFGTTTLGMMTMVDLGTAGILWLLFALAVMFGWLGPRGRFKGQLQWYLGLQVLIMMVYASNLTILSCALPFIYLVMLSCHWDRVEQAVAWRRQIEQSASEKQ